jgi:lipopolysaccharide biosynthesis glycosyltransferase
MIKVFIGYDTKETIAYHVCSNSIIRHASKPVSIVPLSLNLLSDYIETHADGSNDFVYTRFLVPHLMDYNGWAIFLDGDMVVTEDIDKLWQLRDDTKAVMVVKHNYKTKSNQKYLGQPNADYPRKNWSSVVLWNCAHPANKSVTVDFVQTATGSQVHRFSWLTDDLIGELPIEWNWLADEYGVNTNAKLIHYTLGTPCFEEFNNSPMADLWHDEHLLTNYVSKP